MTIAAGTKLGRYEIRSKIGAGGMGEVYLAQDTKLDRKVALKILPADVAGHQDRMRRFVQEAKAASALNHPNIITIHEIDQTDSGHFIATEFIDGQTLRERELKPPVKLAESLDIAAQIASALAAAHAAGIVHRDIKPPGRVMGTVAYMSPEQVRGLELDVRTDIWSLGVVLYEMLAGQPPFGGETSSHVSVSILEREPAPLGQSAPEIPTANRKPDSDQLMI